MGIRIAIVEDNPQYRAGLTALLSAEPRFEVATSIPAAPPAIQAVENGARWDLIVMDSSLPGVSGSEAIAQIEAIDARPPIEVFERLGISIDTARTYVRRVYEKLQVRIVAQAVSRALRERLV